MKSVKKVINLYLTECSGENMYNRSGEYRVILDAFREKLNGGGPDVENALDELLAITERMAFEDGFTAGVRHIIELYDMARK